MTLKVVPTPEQYAKEDAVNSDLAELVHKYQQSMCQEVINFIDAAPFDDNLKGAKYSAFIDIFCATLLAQLARAQFAGKNAPMEAYVDYSAARAAHMVMRAKQLMEKEGLFTCSKQ